MLGVGVMLGVGDGVMGVRVGMGKGVPVAGWVGRGVNVAASAASKLLGAYSALLTGAGVHVAGAGSWVGVRVGTAAATAKVGKANPSAAPLAVMAGWQPANKSRARRNRGKNFIVSQSVSLSVFQSVSIHSAIRIPHSALPKSLHKNGHLVELGVGGRERQRGGIGAVAEDGDGDGAGGKCLEGQVGLLGVGI